MKNIKFINNTIDCPICEKNNFSFIGYNGGKYHPNKKGLRSKIFKYKNCALLLPNPLPLPQNIQEIYNHPDEYFSYHASKNWEKRSIEHQKTIKTLLKKILAKNNMKIVKYRIWSPAKPNFKINYKNFVFYFIFYFINYIGNILKLSQNIFLYAKRK